MHAVNCAKKDAFQLEKSVLFKMPGMHVCMVCLKLLIDEDS